jgi:hypothetical protein
MAETIAWVLTEQSDKISARDTIVLIQAVWVLCRRPGFLTVMAATPGTDEQRQYMSRVTLLV